jgi:type I restriction enzyme S subunit
MNSEGLEGWALPAGWEWRRLSEGDVAEVIMGQSPPGKTYNEKGEGLPFFQGKADFGNLHPTPRRWCTAPKKIAEPGDVLISVRAPVGPTNLCAETCCIGRGLAAIRPGHRTDSKFLLFALRAMEPEIIQRGQGSTFSAITKRDLLSCQIPLPPLDEQRRIVARVEELFARIEEAQLLRAAAGQYAERLMPAALTITFRQARRQATKIASLGSVCEVEMGQSPPGDSYHSEPKGLPLLNGPTEFGIEYPTPVQWTTAPTKVCQPGDLLICVRGATTGRTNWADQSYCIGRGIAAIRSRDSEETLLNYVAHYVHAQADEILAAGRGSTFPNLTKTQLISWDLPLLTLEEQRHIIEYLDGVQTQVMELKRLQAESAAELERLSGAVLARAFRREL